MWSSWGDFWDMGGYGGYIWSAYGAVALAVAMELLFLRRRLRQALRPRRAARRRSS